MQAIEQIDGDSLYRFQRITDFLIEIGYKLKEGYPKKNEDKRLEWVFINPNGDEESLNEETIFKKDYMTLEDSQRRMNIHYDKISDPAWLREHFIKNK